MKNKSYCILLASAFCISLISCTPLVKPAIVNKLVTEGLIDCFPPGLKGESLKLVYCEASGVAAYNDHLIVVSDKAIPQRSPAFTLKQIDGKPMLGSTKYLKSQTITSAKKYEDLTITPDKKYIIATTAFDRHLAKDAKWDVYNSFIYWPSEAPDAADIALQSKRQGVSSSLSFRKRLSNVLGKEYFKVEGLAALPNNQLLIGIRELGSSYKDFEYKILVLKLEYSFNSQGQLLLGNAFDVLLDFKPARDSALQGLSALGLSSLEYFPKTDEVLFSTSWEHDEGMGGYLWKVNRSQLLSGNAEPSLFKDAQGRPISFQNKVEGIAVLDNNRLFVVHDDDRVVHKHLNRSPHQAAYSLIQLPSNQ